MMRVHPDNCQPAARTKQPLSLSDELFEALEVVNSIHAKDHVNRLVAEGQGLRSGAQQSGTRTLCGRMAQHFQGTVDATNVRNGLAQRRQPVSGPAADLQRTGGPLRGYE